MMEKIDSLDPEGRQPNGQWIKSIKFRLPVIEEDMELGSDEDRHVETYIASGDK